MSLSNELIMRFVRATKDPAGNKSETTLYGTLEESGSRKYVRLDGSDLLTPVESTSDARHGDRVTVMIKNHTATVTGNLSSPSARTAEVEGKLDIVEAVRKYATIENLDATNVNVSGKLNAKDAEVMYATIGQLNATNANVAGKLSAKEAEIKYATIERLEALEGEFDDINTGSLTAEEADLRYANIDFTNIGQAAMQYFYAQSGLIKNVVVGDQTITGELVGVTISGDRILGNTVVAEKLVIKGSDGLYYKLNTDGMKVEAQQTDENSLNGQVIKAKSITATKISVDDLVAFDATIGGFNITENSIYSGVKESVGNTTRGVYLDNEGQVAFGDSSNFIKYFKDSDGKYKLNISVSSLSISGNTDIGNALENLQNGIENIETKITDASKTASNFIAYDASNGLQVGNKTSGAWQGFRSQITSAAFRILNASGTVLASYGEKIVELGRNATDAVIKLCGGKGQIEYSADEDTGHNFLQIFADRLRLRSSVMSSLYSMFTDNSTRWEKSAVNVSPTKVSMFASECIEPTLVEKVEGWTTSEFDMDGTDISATADNVGLTGRKKVIVSADNGNIELRPLGRVFSNRQILVSASEKTKHNDGIAGWYLGTDGTAHTTHASGGSIIAFHFAGSTSNTSTIAESAAGEIKINGMRFGVNKVLWSGASYMNGTQSITLNEAVSKQTSGIVLVFSYFENNAAKDHSFTTHFVPKKEVELFPGCGHTYLMAINAGFSAMGAKYLTFTDTTITGHSGNVSSGTNSGITFNNSNYVLRYVIGV